MNQPVETSGQNAEINQRRPVEQANAPALEQNPQPVRRTPGLKIDDVLEWIEELRDAHVASMEIAKNEGVNSLTLDHYHHQVMGIDMCRDEIVSRYAIQSF